MEWFVLVQQTLASLFVILMSLFLLFWCLPEGYFFRDLLHTKLGRYICWAGLDNYWSLFAPRPISKNFLIGFEIELANGTVVAWKLPPYTLKDDYQLTDHFRFIKMHNQLLSQKDPIPKEAICRYVLRQYRPQQDAANPAIRVHLLQYYEPPVNGTFQLIPWMSQVVYTHDVIEQLRTPAV
ncbi:hypothetical protein [Spirosoma sordidisoli]|uniref:Uncharacterized protein n=1 Tax=Spirosoma sordidisoli TaxID=2502893 RepID=A0A4Q2ULL1_9BACT|nr:hypothetical protein [Spirosoma sordidisoli]RYC67729.1 hypothetical protein EQG79_23800 [Spirosoma sordidisoli]